MQPSLRRRRLAVLSASGAALSGAMLTTVLIVSAGVEDDAFNTSIAAHPGGDLNTIERRNGLYIVTPIAKDAAAAQSFVNARVRRSPVRRCRHWANQRAPRYIAPRSPTSPSRACSSNISQLERTSSSASASAAYAKPNRPNEHSIWSGLPCAPITAYAASRRASAHESHSPARSAPEHTCSLLDEPTSRLDEENAGLVAALLARIARQLETGTICTSHDPEVVALADRKLSLLQLRRK